MRRSFGAALAATVLLVSCGVTAGDSLNPCTESVPSACGMTARCVLGSNEYLSGQFPGSQTFVLRTTNPEQVTFSFDFGNRVSPGTTLTLSATEPDCSETSTHTSQGDIFQLAGASGILSFPITLTEPGDHMIQFSSDAYCSYDLAYQ